MNSFTIAHLKIQNVDVVIVFLNETFDHKTDEEQREIQMGLQLCARNAKLAGNVVLLWMDSQGRTRFIAPQRQHPFFKTASYQQLYSQANKTLQCG
jgi:hypothetical protein